jgi:hypothetical protein
LEGLDPNNLNAKYQQPQRDIAGMEDSFEQNLLPLFESNPGVEFDIVWPPYSILVWLDFEQRHQLDLTLQFKRYVWETTRALRNVHVVDIESVRSTTHDLDLYTDAYHYAPVVNNFVVRAACAREYLVNQGNIDSLDKELRAQVSAFDLRSAIQGRTPESPP